MQRACAIYLESRRNVVRDLVYTHIPHGGKRRRVEAAIFKGIGVVAGAPDFVIWRKGGGVANIELKAKGGRLSPAQKSFGDGLRALGHSYHVINAETPSDAVTQLQALLGAA